MAARVVEILERSVEHVATHVGQLPERPLSRTTERYGRQVPQWAVLFQLLAHMNEHAWSPPWSRSLARSPPLRGPDRRSSRPVLILLHRPHRPGIVDRARAT